MDYGDLLDVWKNVRDVETARKPYRNPTAHIFPDRPGDPFGVHPSRQVEMERLRFQHPFSTFFNPENLSADLMAPASWSVPQLFLVMYSVADGALPFPLALLPQNAPLAFWLMMLLKTKDMDVFEFAKEKLSRLSLFRTHRESVRLNADLSILSGVFGDEMKEWTFRPADYELTPPAVVVGALVALSDEMFAAYYTTFFPLLSSTDPHLFSYVLDTVLFPLSKAEPKTLKPDIEEFTRAQIDFLRTLRPGFRPLELLLRYMTLSYPLIRAYAEEIAELDDFFTFMPVIRFFETAKDLKEISVRRAEKRYELEMTRFRKTLETQGVVPDFITIGRDAFLARVKQATEWSIVEKRDRFLYLSREWTKTQTLFFVKTLIYSGPHLQQRIRDMLSQTDEEDWQVVVNDFVAFARTEFLEPVFEAIVVGGRPVVGFLVSSGVLDRVYYKMLDSFVKLINWPVQDHPAFVKNRYEFLSVQVGQVPLPFTERQLLDTVQSHVPHIHDALHHILEEAPPNSPLAALKDFFWAFCLFYNWDGEVFDPEALALYLEKYPIEMGSFSQHTAQFIEDLFSQEREPHHEDIWSISRGNLSVFLVVFYDIQPNSFVRMLELVFDFVRHITPRTDLDFLKPLFRHLISKHDLSLISLILKFITSQEGYRFLFDFLSLLPVSMYYQLAQSGYLPILDLLYTYLVMDDELLEQLFPDLTRETIYFDYIEPILPFIKMSDLRRIKEEYEDEVDIPLLDILRSKISPMHERLRYREQGKYRF